MTEAAGGEVKMSMNRKEICKYGIVATVTEIDRVLRRGAKAWMVRSESGGEMAIWLARSRSGRFVEKHSPIWRFDNFRCKWIPEHLRARIWMSGTKEEMEQEADRWRLRAEQARHDHPNRQYVQPN